MKIIRPLLQRIRLFGLRSLIFLGFSANRISFTTEFVLSLVSHVYICLRSNDVHTCT
jgi:hypothetical protein